MKPRTLITGGAGFIGSHLTDFLVAHGHRVTVLDDFSTGRIENLEDAGRTGDVRIVRGSVLDRSALKHAMENCTRVFHLAVQCVRRSIGQPVENHEINATGSLLTLEAARSSGITRFVYCSSSEVYGNSSSDELHNEDATQCEPMTIYGAAKLAGEFYSKAYLRTYGLPVVVVRPFNAYGPREHAQGDLAEVIPRFVIRLLNGQPPIIFGDGTAGRDFTYVTDVARGIALAGECEALVGHTVNIAFGRMVTIAEIAAMLASLCGRPDIKPLHIQPRPGEVHALRADTHRARTLLGFAAGIELEDGLERYLNWFRTQHNDPSALLEEDPRNWKLPNDDFLRAGA